MKKNITINLFGSLYAIDEDAYELLLKYENNLRVYFSKQEGGDEIVDDIERRIAELFEELKLQGAQAINIENVEDIIHRIGKPEEMATEDGEDTEKGKEGKTMPQEPAPHKKLFRDPTDRMLGGVMSGLAHYFGGEVLLWRILVILLCIFTSFAFLLVYIGLWIIIPEARTAEDYLMMRGKSVTTDSIGETVVNGVNETGTNTKIPRTGFDSFLSFCILLLKIILYVLGGLLLFTCVLAFIAAIVVGIVGLVSQISTGTPFSTFMGMDSGFKVIEFMPFLPAYTTTCFWILIVSSILLLSIPIYCAVHHIMHLRHKSEQMSTQQRTMWVVAWIISLGLVIGSAVLMGTKISKAQKAYDDKYNPTTNCVSEDAWENLEDDIDDDDANSDDDSSSEETGVKQALLDSLGIHLYSYIDTKNFQDENSQFNVVPGIYRLKIQALADNEGCMAYVRGENMKKLEEISFGNPSSLGTKSKRVVISNGKEKLEVLDSDGIHHTNHSTKSKSVFISNGKQKVEVLEGSETDYTNIPTTEIDSIVVKTPQDLHFGITTMKSITGKKWEGKYILYSNRYKLEKVADLPSQKLSHKTKNKKK